MGPDEEVRDYLDLSADYLESAKRDVVEGRLAPARLSMHQALELALKAGLMAKTRKPGQEWSTHNVHGSFAKHFRGLVPDATLTRINRLVQEYGRSRYPGWPTPAEDEMKADVDFVATLVEETIPRLVEEAST